MRYRDIVFIGNRKSQVFSCARTEGPVTRTRAGRKARDIVTQGASERAGEESSRFLRPCSFKKRPLTRGGKEGQEKKERKRAFKKERGSLPPNNTKRPPMVAEVPFHGDAVLWYGLNGVDSHSLAMNHLPSSTSSSLFPRIVFFLCVETRLVRACHSRNVPQLPNPAFGSPFALSEMPLKQFYQKHFALFCAR